MKIGLLGGSFNPAHAGHLYISEVAIRQLGLQQLWWLVSPQNPLKSTTDMMSFEKRFESAQKIARHPKIIVSDIERRLGTQYTADTLSALRRRFRGDKFVWIMGADNLIQLPKWKKWEEIFHFAEIHVFDRAELFYPAVKGIAWARHKDKITYHRIRKIPISSTEIRNNQ